MPWLNDLTSESLVALSGSGEAHLALNYFKALFLENTLQ